VIFNTSPESDAVCLSDRLKRGSHGRPIPSAFWLAGYSPVLAWIASAAAMAFLQ
jgi:hypothetical protein